MIDREYLKQKRAEYHNLYMQALGAANANHGAMQAMDELLAQLDAEEAEPVDLDRLLGGGNTNISVVPQ